jgi:hypothetical protein
VTGPPAFGASAVVGTGTSYARNDHIHGAPATTPYADFLAADIALTVAPQDIFSYEPAAGVWLVAADIQIDCADATGGAVDVWIGTTSATWASTVSGNQIAVGAAAGTSSAGPMHLGDKLTANGTTTYYLSAMETTAITTAPVVEHLADGMPHATRWHWLKVG